MISLKKIICLLLCVITALGCCACGVQDAVEKASGQTLQLNATGQNHFEGVADFQIVRIVETADVMPPKPSSVYSHYAADSGMTYLVVMMDVKNLASQRVRLDDIFKLTIECGGIEKKATAAGVEDGGTDLSGYYSADPLETVRAYYMIQVPVGTAMNNINLTAVSGDTTISGTVSIDTYANAVKTLVKGVTISDETVEFTVTDVFTTNDLKPPKPDSYYSHFEADAGNLYLVLQCNVKNLMGTDLEYDKIAGVTCTYQGKYNYSSTTVFTEDEGADLSSYASINSMKPLEKNTVYYLITIPEEAKNGPLEIQVFVANQFYKYNIG